MPREYGVAAILLLLFMVLISLVSVLNVIIIIIIIIVNTHLQLFKFHNIYKYIIFINFGNYYI